MSAYTYSKSIDDTSGVRPGSGDVLTPNNPFNLNSGERALSGFDARHRWVTSGFIELPFGKGKRFLSSTGGLGNALAGGWQLGGILTLQTGMPATPQDGSFDPPNLGGGLGYTPRPNATGISPVLSNPSPSRWFNSAAFVVQPVYTFGNAGRNAIHGPGLVDMDLSLMKRFTFTERIGSELRWEVFNAANHPIFALPNATLSSAAYGTIAGTIVDSRQMQLGLRIVF